MVWVMLASQLGYYRNLYGPEILLQLNIAFYLPSIPVLILIGYAERVLDQAVGPATSMLARLLTGLLGCAAICAAFPFIPQHLDALLCAVGMLGAFSAVAFSTSYQLVASFR